MTEITTTTFESTTPTTTGVLTTYIATAHVTNAEDTTTYTAVVATKGESLTGTGTGNMIKPALSDLPVGLIMV